MKKRQDAKIRFSAMPARMMGDTGLSALDMRVLMAIAAHDQFGGNGTGCFASHSTLAALVDCHLKSLSRSIHALGQAGYLEARVNPLNKKTRIYSVIYSDADAAYLQSVKAKKGSKVATHDGEIGNGTDTEKAPYGNMETQIATYIGNRSAENPQSEQPDTEGNIFCEAERKSSKADQRDSGEPAPPMERRLSNGELMSRIERQLKYEYPSRMTLRMFARQVESILDETDGGSQEYGWSERLLGDIHHRIELEDETPF